ncbi:MAG TPA: DUF1416 domain-containing protein [Gemmataceae bacterium]|nr:DUF1416 domain-containing protein [Gemmataceae bacterium]
MTRFVPACGLTALLAFFAGCSGNSEATVTGEVTLDNQPLKKGRIQFVSADGKTTAAEAEVADGKYAVKVAPGEYKVKISADKVVGKHKMYDTPDSPEVEDVRQLIDARFNDNTELKMTVQSGSQEKKFEVTSRR